MPTIEVLCPACGAVVEGDSEDDLVERAREHTVDAHGYSIPTEHVLAAAVRDGEEPSAAECGMVIDADLSDVYDDHYKQ